MKFNFKKLASVAATTVMLGSTIAAAYPAPFVESGVAGGAVVYGANAALSDASAAIDLMNDLNSNVVSTGGETTVTGGDSYVFEKTSTKFHLGRGVLDIVSTDVTDDQLPTLLADGKFIDDDNDEFDYTQKIEMSNLSLTMFNDNDYKKDTPTVGIKISNNDAILNYTLDFSDEPLFTDLATTDIPLIGKSYYVLTVAAANNSLTLLDSAVDTVLAEGETTTLDVEGTSYEVAINFIGATPEVKLEVNGEVTNSLNEAETYKLSDGSYIGIKDILYNSKDTGISKVEFSIGSGKLKLTHGSDIEMNDDSVSNMRAFIGNTSTGKLSNIILDWSADDELFVAEDSEVLMPGFEAVKLSYGGLTAQESETIKVSPDGNNNFILEDFPLKDSTEDIVFFYFDGVNFTMIGKDADELLRTSGSSGVNAQIVFDGDTDAYFVASWSDGDDAESYLMKATDFKTESNVNKTTIKYKKDGAWVDAKSEAQEGNSVTLGNVELVIGNIQKADETVQINGTANVDFHTVYSKGGMKVLLPYSSAAYLSATGAINITGNGTDNYTASYDMIISEEDKDDNKGIGKNITLTLADNTNDEVSVETVTEASVTREEDGDSTKIYKSFVYSALASTILEDESGDQEAVTIIYNGGEVYGKVYLTAPEASVISAGDEAKVVVVKDSEASSVADKNLIVVGGSCINTVAATILGSESPICGEAFSEATNVAAGQYLIKTVTSPLAADKVAMLVAGYDAEDTVNAVAKVKEGADSTVGTEQVYPMASA